MDDRILYGTPERLAPLPPAGVETLPDLLRWQASRQPEAVLLSISEGSGSVTRSLTYRETVEKSSAVAALLRSRLQLDLTSPASPSAPVFAVWCEKSLELHLALFATTLAAATWLPFDPDVPSSRVRTCVEDASAHALLCDGEHLERAREAIQGLQVPVFTIEELLSQPGDARPASPPIFRPRPDDAAYFIYTSGTTGTPKGISIPHSAALTFSLSERSVLANSPTDVVWQGFSPAFDMFVEETWVSIAGGAHLTVGTREECQDITGLGGERGIWAKRGVTVVNAVPTLMSIMVTLGGSDTQDPLPASIRLVNLGGEACPPSLVPRIARPGRRRLINTYGPSETTVTATFDELLPGQLVTIGAPLPSYTACILPIDEDEDASSSTPSNPLQLAAGVEGELAIGGACVGHGYVGRPELTATKFLQHPLLPSGKLYRTGDRVSLTADGKIAFLGRIDTQVKHRGFRIELGEIESALSSHSNVRAAACVLANPNSEQARLEAFIVLTDAAQGSLNEAAWSESLRGSLTALPSYMHPEAFIFIAPEEMPRLPSGKINVKALQEVSKRHSERQARETLANSAASASETATLAEAQWDDGSPRSIIMKALAAIFPQAGPSLNPKADFFSDLGGHSLAAAMFVNRLRQQAGRFSSLGLSDVYSAKTAEALAERLAPQMEPSSAPESSSSSIADTLQEKTGLDSSLPGHLPVSPTLYILCGLAQSVCLVFFFFISSLEILVPYILFDVVLNVSNVGYAILAAYGVFVVIPFFSTAVGIIGKWLALGRAQPGEYRLYGLYYFRWWLAERFVSMLRPKVIAGSPLHAPLLRLLGANIGSHCHLGSMVTGAASDLLEIGSDVVVEPDVVMAMALVERGRLVLRRIIIEDDAIIGGNSVLEGGSVVEQGGELGALSMLPQGQVLPAGQVWKGSPAVFHGDAQNLAQGRATRPSPLRKAYVSFACFFIVGLILPLLYFAPQVPGLLLFNYLDLRDVSKTGQTGIVALPVAAGYTILVFLELLAFRWLFLGRLEPGSYSTWSTFYIRKWFVDRIMDLSLDILHPVYATLYVVPFLRSLGTTIGSWAEVSTARGINFQLIEVGAESFVADSVWMGGDEVRGNMLTLRHTKLEPRAFAGNASYLPAGTVLPTGSLVGVLSIAPEKTLSPGQSCFGSPPVLMPARQAPESQHADHLLYHPRAKQIAARLFIEGMRIFLPRALIVFGLGFGLQIINASHDGIGWVYTLLMLPAYYFFLFALPALLFTLLCKWLLVGRYKPASWPLWSLNVWLSEFVTSTLETLANPLLINLLIGTPMLSWCMRLFGVRIGSRVTLLSSDMTEMDLVSLGDEAALNAHCGPQTHLFQDRIMQLGHVHIGERATMKPYSIALPNSSIDNDGELGSLSLLMKNEHIEAGTSWEGAPIQPKRARKEALRWHKRRRAEIAETTAGSGWLSMLGPSFGASTTTFVTRRHPDKAGGSSSRSTSAHSVKTT